MDFPLQNFVVLAIKIAEAKYPFWIDDRAKANSLWRTRNRLCADLFQQIESIFIRGYRYYSGTRREGYEGSTNLWGKIGRDEYQQPIRN